jgi:hypothetical protein
VVSDDDMGRRGGSESWTAQRHRLKKVKVKCVPDFHPATWNPHLMRVPRSREVTIESHSHTAEGAPACADTAGSPGADTTTPSSPTSPGPTHDLQSTPSPSHSQRRRQCRSRQCESRTSCHCPAIARLSA